MAFSSSSIRKHHALAIPLPAQGHLNPLMRFCKLLASQGFAITFVNVDPIHHRIVELSTEQQQQQQQEEEEERQKIKHEDINTTENLDIRKAHIPIAGLDLSNDFRVSLEYFFEAQQGLAADLVRLLEKLNQEDLPVTCLISDMFMTGPTQKVADKFNIPRIVLFPSSQSFQLLVYYLTQGQISTKNVLDVVMKRKMSKATDVFQEDLLIPGLPTLLNRDLPDFNHVANDNEYIYGFVARECQESNARAHAIAVNSFEELESPAFKAFTSRLHIPIYSVGPLVGRLENESSTSLWKEDEGCLHWLDQQPPLSVLYVSFGSVTLLSQRQFEEILLGLHSSQQRFLWVFRPDLVESSPYDTFPSDFLDKTNGTGYVVNWAPQLRVLSHPSLGGFLTHCGWNSTIEAIALGVPMLCWPYFADQCLDAKYIVEVWRVGLRFEEYSGEGNFVEGAEVERVIRALMEGEEGKVLRENAAKLRDAGRQSLLPGGTSHKNIQALIQSLGSTTNTFVAES